MRLWIGEPFLQTKLAENYAHPLEASTLPVVQRARHGRPKTRNCSHVLIALVACRNLNGIVPAQGWATQQFAVHHNQSVVHISGEEQVRFMPAQERNI